MTYLIVLRKTEISLKHLACMHTLISKIIVPNFDENVELNRRKQVTITHKFNIVNSGTFNKL